MAMAIVSYGSPIRQPDLVKEQEVPCMKRRFWSVCLALALCWTLLPATALAADGDTVYVGGVELMGSSTTPV